MCYGCIYLLLSPVFHTPKDNIPNIKIKNKTILRASLLVLSLKKSSQELKRERKLMFSSVCSFVFISSYILSHVSDMAQTICSYDSIIHSSQWSHTDICVRHGGIKEGERKTKKKDGKEERLNKSLHGERVRENHLWDGKSVKEYKFIHHED